MSTHMVLPVVEDQHTLPGDEAGDGDNDEENGEDGEDDKDDEDELLGPWSQESSWDVAAQSHRLAVSGWFTTTDAARAIGVESMVVSLQPCEAATPMFNT